MSHIHGKSGFGPSPLIRVYIVCSFALNLPFCRAPAHVCQKEEHIHNGYWAIRCCSFLIYGLPSVHKAAGRAHRRGFVFSFVSHAWLVRKRPPSSSCSAIMSSNATAWVPNNNASSAFVGDPPNTQRDWYIVRGLLRVVGMSDVDPAEGYLPAAAVRTDGAYATKRPGVIAGLVVVLLTILGVTGARLALRASVSQMRFGVDDWATIAAAVRSSR